MAAYAVTNNLNYTYAEQPGGKRFKTRAGADAFLADAEREGRFAIMFKWENGECKEMTRGNDRGR